MKILIINKFLHPNGGSETYIFEIGTQLQKMGHEVQYFGMENENRIVGNRVNCYTTNMDFHIGKLERLIYPMKIIYSLEARKKLRKVLDDFSPDVVHLNNFNFQLTPSVIYEIIKYREQNEKEIKIIYTAHDYQLICPNHSLRIQDKNENCERCLGGNYLNCVQHRCIHNSRVKSIIGAMEGWIYRKLKTYRYIDKIICPSFFLEQKILSNPVFHGKTIVMHNFVNAGDNNENIVKNGNYVLYFGRYAQEKGITTLLRVCEKLKEIPFVFAGKGPLEEKVNQVTNIKNMGFLKGERLEQIIRNASFTIYPSEWYENCPFSVMESIAYGTPVIGADIGGIPELIQAGITGEIFKSGDEKELCAIIKKLWNDQKLLSKYSDNCKADQFDNVETYCDALMRVYQGNL